MKPVLIGLVGYAGAGKTTTTRAAINGMGIEHISFSDPIRDMMIALGIPAAVYDDKSRWNDPEAVPELCGRTLRHATQTLGTEWGRNTINPALWSNLALRRASKLMGSGSSVIIDNVRFSTEFEAIEQAGGVTVAFHRVGYIPSLLHDSERQIGELQERAHYQFWHESPFADSNVRFRRLLRHVIDVNQ